MSDIREGMALMLVVLAWPLLAVLELTAFRLGLVAGDMLMIVGRVLMGT